MYLTLTGDREVGSNADARLQVHEHGKKTMDGSHSESEGRKSERIGEALRTGDGHRTHFRVLLPARGLLLESGTCALSEPSTCLRLRVVVGLATSCTTWVSVAGAWLLLLVTR